MSESTPTGAEMLEAYVESTANEEDFLSLKEAINEDADTVLKMMMDPAIVQLTEDCAKSLREKGYEINSIDDITNHTMSLAFNNEEVMSKILDCVLSPIDEESLKFKTLLEVYFNVIDVEVSEEAINAIKKMADLTRDEGSALGKLDDLRNLL